MTVLNWLTLHVPLLIAAYSLLFMGALAGALFLLQERLIKNHRPLPVLFHLPPLETTERFIFRTVFAAYPLLTFGILFGAFWQHAVQNRYWNWDPTESFCLITWIVYTAYLVFRWMSGWRGRRATYLALAGFGLVLLSLTALAFFSPLHQSGAGV